MGRDLLEVLQEQQTTQDISQVAGLQQTDSLLDAVQRQDAEFKQAFPVRHAWRTQIRPILETLPFGMDPASMPAQAYRGYVEGLTAGNIKPWVEQPDQTAEKVIHEGFKLAGLGTNIAAVTAAVRNPTVAGFLYGAMGETGYDAGSAEDIATRIGQGADTAMWFAIFGGLGKAVTPKTMKAFDAITGSKIMDPNVRGVLAHAISNMVIGSGFGAMDPAESLDERLRNMAVGGLGFTLGGLVGEGIPSKTKQGWKLPKDVRKAQHWAEMFGPKYRTEPMTLSDLIKSSEKGKKFTVERVLTEEQGVTAGKYPGVMVEDVLQTERNQSFTDLKLQEQFKRGEISRVYTQDKHGNLIENTDATGMAYNRYLEDLKKRDPGQYRNYQEAMLKVKNDFVERRKFLKQVAEAQEKAEKAATGIEKPLEEKPTEVPLEEEKTQQAKGKEEVIISRQKQVEIQQEKVDNANPLRMKWNALLNTYPTAVESAKTLWGKDYKDGWKINPALVADIIRQMDTGKGGFYNFVMASSAFNAQVEAHNMLGEKAKGFYVDTSNLEAVQDAVKNKDVKKLEALAREQKEQPLLDLNTLLGDFKKVVKDSPNKKALHQLANRLQALNRKAKRTPTEQDEFQSILNKVRQTIGEKAPERLDKPAKRIEFLLADRNIQLAKKLAMESMKLAEHEALAPLAEDFSRMANKLLAREAAALSQLAADGISMDVLCRETGVNKETMQAIIDPSEGLEPTPEMLKQREALIRTNVFGRKMASHKLAQEALARRKAIGDIPQSDSANDFRGLEGKAVFVTGHTGQGIDYRFGQQLTFSSIDEALQFLYSPESTGVMRVVSKANLRKWVSDRRVAMHEQFDWKADAVTGMTMDFLNPKDALKYREDVSLLVYRRGKSPREAAFARKAGIPVIEVCVPESVLKDSVRETQLASKSDLLSLSQDVARRQYVGGRKSPFKFEETGDVLSRLQNVMQGIHKAVEGYKLGDKAARLGDILLEHFIKGDIPQIETGEGAGRRIKPAGWNEREQKLLNKYTGPKAYEEQSKTIGTLQKYFGEYFKSNVELTPDTKITPDIFRQSSDMSAVRAETAVMSAIDNLAKKSKAPAFLKAVRNTKAKNPANSIKDIEKLIGTDFSMLDIKDQLFEYTVNRVRAGDMRTEVANARGVTPNVERKLLKAFKGIQGLREAIYTLENPAEVLVKKAGVTAKQAREVVKWYEKWGLPAELNEYQGLLDSIGGGTKEARTLRNAITDYIGRQGASQDALDKAAKLINDINATAERTSYIYDYVLDGMEKGTDVFVGKGGVNAFIDEMVELAFTKQPSLKDSFMGKDKSRVISGNIAQNHEDINGTYVTVEGATIGNVLNRVFNATIKEKLRATGTERGKEQLAAAETLRKDIFKFAKKHKTNMARIVKDMREGRPAEGVTLKGQLEYWETVARFKKQMETQSLTYNDIINRGQRVKGIKGATPIIIGFEGRGPKGAKGWIWEDKVGIVREAKDIRGIRIIPKWDKKTKMFEYETITSRDLQGRWETYTSELETLGLAMERLSQGLHTMKRLVEPLSRPDTESLTPAATSIFRQALSLRRKYPLQWKSSEHTSLGKTFRPDPNAPVSEQRVQREKYMEDMQGFWQNWFKQQGLDVDMRIITPEKKAEMESVLAERLKKGRMAPIYLTGLRDVIEANTMQEEMGVGEVGEGLGHFGPMTTRSDKGGGMFYVDFFGMGSLFNFFANRSWTRFTNPAADTPGGRIGLSQEQLKEQRKYFDDILKTSGHMNFSAFHEKDAVYRAMRFSGVPAGRELMLRAAEVNKRIGDAMTEAYKLTGVDTKNKQQLKMIWRQMYLAGEDIMIPDPARPWMYSKTKLGQTRHYWDNLRPEYREILLKLKAEYKQMLKDGVDKGFFSPKAAEAEAEVGYMPRIALNEKGELLSRGVLADKAYTSSQRKRSKGEGDARKGIEEVERDIRAAGHEMEDYFVMDPQKMILHQILEQSKSVDLFGVINDLMHTNTATTGEPMVMYKASAPEGLNWNNYRAMDGDYQRRKFGSYAGGDFKPLWVHKDAMESYKLLEEFYGGKAPKIGAGQGNKFGRAYNKVRGLHKLAVLMNPTYQAWQVYNSLIPTCMNGAAWYNVPRWSLAALQAGGSMLKHAMAGLPEVSLLGINKIPGIQSLRKWQSPKELLDAATRHGLNTTTHRNALSAFTDDFLGMVEFGPGKSKQRMLEDMVYDKAGLTRWLWKAAEGASVQAWDMRRRQLMKEGFAERQAGIMAADNINTAFGFPSNYAFSRSSANFWRYVLLARNAQLSLWKQASGMFGRGPVLGPLDTRQTLTLGHHGWTEKELKANAQFFRRQIMSQVLGFATMAGIYSYLVGGVFPWEKPRDEWFEVDTGMVDEMGNGITWTPPLFKDVRDLAMLLGTPWDVSQGKAMRYFGNKKDPTLGLIVNTALGEEWWGDNTIDYDEGAPPQERLKHGIMRFINSFDPGFVKLTDYEKMRSSKEDMLGFVGVRTGRSTGGVGQDYLDYQDLMRLRATEKYEKGRIDQKMKQAWMAGDYEELMMLAMDKGEDINTILENFMLRMTNPYAYKFQTSTKRVRRQHLGVI